MIDDNNFTPTIFSPEVTETLPETIERLSKQLEHMRVANQTTAKVLFAVVKLTGGKIVIPLEEIKFRTTDEYKVYGDDGTLTIEVV